MKKTLLFVVILLGILFITGCSTVSPKVKECTQLCFENGGKVSQYLYDQCQSSCSQLEYYGGEAKIDQTIEKFRTETQANEVVYGTKQAQEDVEVVAHQNIDGCKKLTQNAENLCVMKFVNEDESFDDSSVCSSITDKKDECLSILNLRKAMRTNDPSLCKPTSEFDGCYVDYLIKKDVCPASKHQMEQDVCLLNFIDSLGGDLDIEAIKNEFKRNGMPVLGDISMAKAVQDSDYYKCDLLCEKDPSGFNRNSQDCDRVVCLSTVTVFDDSKTYQQCNAHYLKDPIFGEKEGIVNCLMAQARRDNDPQLCEELEKTSPHFIDICKNNVASWNN